MGREILYRCDVCGQLTAPDDCGRERILVQAVAPRAVDPAPGDLAAPAEFLAPLERAAAAAHRDALADARGPAPVHAQDRLVCRRCWPTRPVMGVRVRPHDIDEEVSR